MQRKCQCVTSEVRLQKPLQLPSGLLETLFQSLTLPCKTSDSPKTSGLWENWVTWRSQVRVFKLTAPAESSRQMSSVRQEGEDSRTQSLPRALKLPNFWVLRYYGMQVTIVPIAPYLKSWPREYMSRIKGLFETTRNRGNLLPQQHHQEHCIPDYILPPLWNFPLIPQLKYFLCPPTALSSYPYNPLILLSQLIMYLLIKVREKFL